MTGIQKALVGLLIGGLVIAGAVAVYAQSATVQPGGERGGRGCRGRHGFGMVLHLTPAQRTQARTIFTTARTQAQAVLTPAQLQQFQVDLAARHGGHPGHHGNKLNLTADQQARMQAIRADAQQQIAAIRQDTTQTVAEQQARLKAVHASVRQQMQAVLTPEQQARMQAFRAEHTPAAMATREAAKLQLTPDQRGKLQDIFEHARADFRQLLTPEQQTRFDQMLHARGLDSLSLR